MSTETLENPSPNGTVDTIDDSSSPVTNLTVDALHSTLMDRGYICSRDRARSVLAAMMTKPLGGFFAFGPPGTGKTWLLELLGDVLGMNTFFKQVSPGSREEDLILDLLPDEDAKSGIKKEWGEIPKAVRASQDEPVMLVLDEWDKTRPTADAFLLDFLQNGRVNYGDIEMQANMDNLHVGITLNNERDLSGPAHRRLPFLHFEPLHPSLVRQALVESHGKHPYIEAAVNLYVRCELSHMDKKCTIQELQQLLDAISVLGEEEADWDQLVLDYVTKDKDNHRLLKDTESMDVDDWQDDDIDALDPSAYGEVDDDGRMQNTSSQLPDIVEVRGYTKRTDNDKDPDLSQAFAALRKSDKVYDHLTQVEEAGEEPDEFGRVKVEGETITLNKPVHLSDFEDWIGVIEDDVGEVVFIEPNATREDMRLLQRERDVEFISYTDSEIIARVDTMHIRWTEENGAEIIVSDDALFYSVFMGTWITDTVQEAHEIPPKVLATIGHPDAGTVQSRNEGTPIQNPYFSGIFDKYGSDQIDFYEAGDIPGYTDLMDYAEENSEDMILTDDDSIYLFFENVMIGFIGQENDYLAVSVNGAFDEKLESYLQNLLPGSKLFLNKIAMTDIDETTLIDDHDFEVVKPTTNRKNPNRTLSRMKKGIKSVYTDGKVNVGAQLRGEKITADRVEYITDHIDQMIDELKT